ncbi:MAG: O-antigen ligase family protein [Pirellulales bacterium]
MSTQLLGLTADRDIAQTHVTAARPIMFWLCTLAFVCSFWFTDHNWTQSIYYGSIDESTYSGTENMTADRLADVNANSSSARLLLAAWGAFCIYRAGGVQIRSKTIFFWLTMLGGCILFSSVLWSVNPKFTLFKLAVVGTVIVAAVGFVVTLSARQLLDMLTIACFLFVIVGVVAEISLGTFRPMGNYRFTGTVHPNTLAVYGAVMCLMARVRMVEGGTKWLSAAVLFAAGLAVIMMTKSRTTLAGFAFALLVFQIVITRGSNRILLIVAGLFLAGVFSFAATFAGGKFAKGLGSAAAMGRTEDVGSLTGRLPLWEELIDSIQKRPITGYGYLAYWDAERVEKLSEMFNWEIPHGHNMYLDISLDIGVPGCFIWIVWLLTLNWTAAARYAETRLPVYAGFSGLASLAFMNGFAESLFKLPGLPLFTLIMMAAALLLKAPGTPDEKAVSTDAA